MPVDLLSRVAELRAELGLGLPFAVGPAGGGVVVAFEPVAFARLVVPAVHGFRGVGVLVEESLEVGSGLVRSRCSCTRASGKSLLTPRESTPVIDQGCALTRGVRMRTRARLPGRVWLRQPR
ncbi:hypothetical protein GCM10010211_61200 [Streptomyces albospinus]|uniref:Uncharacterized protein n=1 Tax=Streptomyces albospinus TaxID=285515 RepID=A0ABQ2VJU6_9ACTN|nr:hypothetical protein GCM10010211_61200 [Streptomyces albospinus]